MVVASATPHGDTLGGGASFSYDGFQVWARQSGGVALVRVVDVGPLRWNTEDGTRPPEGALHGPPPGPHADGYGIGRLVRVQRIDLLSGRWLGASDSASFWWPGGTLGADVFETEVQYPQISPGDRAIGFVMPEEGDVGVTSPIPLQVAWLFPVDGSGRVQTLDPAERITLDTIQSVLP